MAKKEAGWLLERLYTDNVLLALIRENELECFEHVVCGK